MRVRFANLSGLKPGTQIQHERGDMQSDERFMQKVFCHQFTFRPAYRSPRASTAPDIELLYLSRARLAMQPTHTHTHPPQPHQFGPVAPDIEWTFAKVRGGSDWETYLSWERVRDKCVGGNAKMRDEREGDSAPGARVCIHIECTSYKLRIYSVRAARRAVALHFRRNFTRYLYRAALPRIL